MKLFLKIFYLCIYIYLIVCLSKEIKKLVENKADHFLNS